MSAVPKALRSIGQRRRIVRFRQAVARLPPVQRRLFSAVVIDGVGVSAAAMRLHTSTYEAEQLLVDGLIVVAAELERQSWAWRWRNLFARKE